ncbi:lysophospholipid acyltransferase 2 [Lates japonicus]|uniref:Lysophospholipid acyltransferase 2 n=1 Tax=Lates japonicus TaxID=270547 RepID=A0AAD3N000_LATJO|nr:lysophospholipid acyltransferase 2 [Lates japonicus]
MYNVEPLVRIRRRQVCSGRGTPPFRSRVSVPQCDGLCWPENMHSKPGGRYCFIVTLGYLILCQITRVYVFDYGMYSADFTG